MLFPSGVMLCLSGVMLCLSGVAMGTVAIGSVGRSGRLFPPVPGAIVNDLVVPVGPFVPRLTVTVEGGCPGPLHGTLSPLPVVLRGQADHVKLAPLALARSFTRSGRRTN